jgi:DNA polymerase
MPHSPLDPVALESVLDFYVEAGVDLALDDEAHDRFAEGAAELAARSNRAASAAPARTPPQTERATASPSAAPVPREGFAAAISADEAALAARNLAREAATLEDLRKAMNGFEGCALKATARQLVFADGNPDARVMLVGEAPGGDEDRMGLPFVGRAGQLLDRMLAAIGLDRTSVYIANVVPWRPPGNRTPTPQEMAACLPFIQRQIELANPDVLVCLGKTPAQALLDMKDGILRMRGTWFDHDTGARTIRALATLHPAYLLRQPLHKRFAWRDMRALKAELDKATIDRASSTIG